MSKYGFSFSGKRVLGVTSAKQKFARETGIPATKTGMVRKLGGAVLGLLFGMFGGRKSGDLDHQNPFKADH